MKRPSILFNERGAVDVIMITCTIIIVALLELAIFVDYWAVSQITSRQKEIVNNLNLDIYSLLDVEYTAYSTGFEIEDETKAYELFYRGLQTRFKLSSSLDPLAGSPFNGRVTISSFHVLDEDEVPFTDGYGHEMRFPGIYVELQVPIKTPLMGLSGVRTVFVTTEIYR